MSQVTNTSSATSAYSAGSSTPAIAPSGTDALANEQTFLKLLVAQLQNQDPLQPQDGTQFVTQLAQFSGLEQNLAMRSDLDAIRTKFVGPSTTTSTGGTTSA